MDISHGPKVHEPASTSHKTDGDVVPRPRMAHRPPLKQPPTRSQESSSTSADCPVVIQMKPQGPSHSGTVALSTALDTSSQSPVALPTCIKSGVLAVGRKCEVHNNTVRCETVRCNTLVPQPGQ